VVTEKSTNLSELNKIVFKVPDGANKKNLKKNIEKIFKVNVTKINIINKQNRTKVTRGRKVKVSGYKKAIITLKKGQSIDPKNAMKGRNNNGHITSINRAGGHKKMYRHVDFYRKKFDMEAKVERIEYDPNRSCYIMLVKFEDSTHAYFLAPQKIKVGDNVVSGSKKEIKVGNCMPLQDIPVGINIHNVEIQPGGGGKIARAAGSSVTISGLDGNYSLIKLASGEVRKIDSRALATIGKQVDQDGWVEDLIQEVSLKTQLITHMEVVKVNQLEEDIQYHLQDNQLKV
jgi:ribosomal protein L2